MTKGDREGAIRSRIAPSLSPLVVAINKLITSVCDLSSLFAQRTIHKQLIISNLTATPYLFPQAGNVGVGGFHNVLGEDGTVEVVAQNSLHEFGLFGRRLAGIQHQESRQGSDQYQKPFHL